jgi:hypothetical protein
MVLSRRYNYSLNIAILHLKYQHNVMCIGVCDYRWSQDWILDLLTTYRSYYKQLWHYHYFHALQFTVTYTSVLSLVQSPPSISWQWILTQELQQSHWITHFKCRGTIAHVKSSLHSQTFNSTELHSIILMPQFLNSTHLLPSSYPGRLASQNSTHSQLPSLLNHLRLLSQETSSILRVI